MLRMDGSCVWAAECASRDPLQRSRNGQRLDQSDTPILRRRRLGAVVAISVTLAFVLHPTAAWVFLFRCLERMCMSHSYIARGVAARQSPIDPLRTTARVVEDGAPR